MLTGADVIVVADRDPAGYAHARTVARSLVGSARSVMVAEPAIGNDIADHLAAGRTVDDLTVIGGNDPGDPPLNDWLRGDGDDGDYHVVGSDASELDVVDWGDVFAGISHEDRMIDSQRGALELSPVG